MYKLKHGAVLLEQFKIKVNPEQSEVVQRHLLSLGYSWGIQGETVMFLGKPYLYTYREKYMKYGVCNLSFEDKDMRELHFDDFFAKESRSQCAYRLSLTTPYTVIEILAFMKFFEDKDLDKAVSFIGASHDVGLPDLQPIIDSFDKIKKPSHAIPPTKSS